MANPQHLDILDQGVGAWNRWRQEHLDIEPDLYEANLSEAHLEGADLSEVHLKRVRLRGAHLERARLGRAHLEEADLSRACLEEAELTVAHLEGTDLSEAHLKRANFNRAHLEGATLNGAHLEGATLNGAHLEGATLNGAHLEGATLNGAHLEGADLSDAFFDNTTRIHNVVLSNERYGSISLADIHWSGVNLAVVDWTPVRELGDEQMARQTKTRNGTKKYRDTRIIEYRTAVRANRQLVVVLRGQGLNEEADHFAYHAQVLQKTVFRLQILERGVTLRRRIRMFFSWLFSWFLYLLAGYGYRPRRSIMAYLLIIAGFAAGYYFLGQWEHVPLSYWGSLVYSVMSFHGRGFFPGTSVHNLSLDEPIVWLAAFEAVIGLVIEISFIATFTQRFFGK